MTATPAAALLIQTVDVALADIPTILLARTNAAAVELAETFAAVLAKIFAAEQAILFTTIAVWAIKLS